MEELTQDGAQLARTMLMSAAQLAESMARVQAQRAWMAQSRSTAQATQAQQQIAAERDAARLIFRPLTEDRYWHDAPQLDRVVQAYMTAAAWAEHDPEARAAVQLIKNHAEARWGREVGDAMRVPRDPSSDMVREAGDAPTTDRQRQSLSKLGVEAGDGSMTAQGSAAIGERLDAEGEVSGVRETSGEPVTDKQRKYLADLGVEPADGMTKAQASQAIKQRLDAPAVDEVRNRGDRSRQEAEIVETVATETVSRQADDRFDRPVVHADSSDDPAAASAASELGRSEHQRQGVDVEVADHRVGAHQTGHAHAAQSDQLPLNAGAELTASGGRGHKDRPNALQESTYKHADQGDLAAKGVPSDAQTARLESAPGIAQSLTRSLGRSRPPTSKQADDLIGPQVTGRQCALARNLQWARGAVQPYGAVTSLRMLPQGLDAVQR